MSLLSRFLRRRSCRTKLPHCKQVSACSERQLDSPHNYSQRCCTHTAGQSTSLFVQPQQLLACERKRQLEHTVYGPSQAATMRPTVSSSTICVRVTIAHAHTTTATLINPRRACAARVTVVVLCVCVCMCLSPLILALQAPNRLMSDNNGSSATSARKIMWRFR